MEAVSSAIAWGWSPVGRYACDVWKVAMRQRYRERMRGLLVTLVAVAASLVAAAGALACACCAETGTWYERTSARGGDRSNTLRVTASGTAWTFTFSGLRPLVLRVPSRATTLGADLHDGR